MAVAHEASSESHTGTSGSQSEDSYSWSHPGVDPKGVLVFTFNLASEVVINNSVTYGGVNVPAVPGGSAVDTAGEAGRCTAWFLGSGVPAGTQTVVVNRTNSVIMSYAIAITVTAAGDVEVTGVTLQQEDQAPAEASVDDGSPGTNSLRYAGAYGGHQNLPGPGANSTALDSIDIGSRIAGAVRETTAGQGARSVGFSSAQTDDWACVLLAIREIAGKGFPFRANPMMPHLAM